MFDQMCPVRNIIKSREEISYLFKTKKLSSSQFAILLYSFCKLEGEEIQSDGSPICLT